MKIAYNAILAGLAVLLCNTPGFGAEEATYRISESLEFQLAQAESPAPSPSDVAPPPMPEEPPMPVEAPADAEYDDCPMADCCCGPLWTAHAGVIFLQRNRSDEHVLVIDGILAPVVDATDFDFEFETGWELAIERHLSPCCSLEARYFEVDDWSESVALPADSGYGFNVSTGNYGLFGGTVSGGVQYTSDLSSFEANLRRSLCCVDLVAGFRYLDLDEDIRLDASNASGFNRVFYDTDNELYGFQLGLDGTIECTSALRLDGSIKFGVYHNEMELTNGNTSDLFTENLNRLEDEGTSYVIELGSTASYAVSCQLNVQFGVQLLWVEDVAVATDQITVNPTPDAGLTTLNAHGSPFYSGFFIGAQYVH